MLFKVVFYSLDEKKLKKMMSHALAAGLRCSAAWEVNRIPEKPVVNRPVHYSGQILKVPFS